MSRKRCFFIGHREASVDLLPALRAAMVQALVRFAGVYQSQTALLFVAGQVSAQYPAQDARVHAFENDFADKVSGMSLPCEENYHTILLNIGGKAILTTRELLTLCAHGRYLYCLD